MSLLDVVQRMKTGTYTVTRTLTGTSPNGLYTPGPSSTLPIVAGIQPVDGVALQDTPEAQYGAETIVIYTETELITRGMESDDSDQISYKGKNYRVTRVQHYDTRSNHYRAYAVKVDTP